MTADPHACPDPVATPRDVLHPVDWTVQVGAVDDVLRGMDLSLARRRRRRQGRGAAAGAALALVAAVAVWWPTSSPAPDGAPPVRPAIVMRPARQVLPDGSIVELRHGARIAPEYTAAVRRVVLVQGQAYFQVARNPARPFVVAVGGVEVRAVGTAFSVQLGSTSVEVLVTEGRVVVDAKPTAAAPAAGSLPASPAPPALAPVHVDAGHRAVVDLPPAPAAVMPPPEVAMVAPAEIDARLAWRVPRLEFSGTPLAEALTLINRYHPVHAVFADSTLGQVRVSGILRADNIENLWRLLGEQHGIRVEHRSDTEVVLSRGQ